MNEVSLNGLKKVNKECYQIFKHEKKYSFFEKKHLGEYKFFFVHDIKHPSGNIES